MNTTEVTSIAVLLVIALFFFLVNLKTTQLLLEWVSLLGMFFFLGLACYKAVVFVEVFS